MGEEQREREGREDTLEGGTEGSPLAIRSADVSSEPPIWHMTRILLDWAPPLAKLPNSPLDLGASVDCTAAATSRTNAGLRSVPSMANPANATLLEAGAASVRVK